MISCSRPKCSSYNFPLKVCIWRVFRYSPWVPRYEGLKIFPSGNTRSVCSSRTRVKRGGDTTLKCKVRLTPSRDFRHFLFRTLISESYKSWSEILFLQIKRSQFRSWRNSTHVFTYQFTRGKWSRRLMIRAGTKDTRELRPPCCSRGELQIFSVFRYRIEYVHCVKTFLFCFTP